MNRIFKPFVFLVAAIYFLVDVVFWSVAKPVACWLAGLRIFDTLRTWIVSLHPYPTLALFSVPLIILEPVKPVAAYLAATGHIGGGLMVLVAGELLKLVVIERLFNVCREKLMSIRAFAWCYDKFRRAVHWVEFLPAWQLARRLSLEARRALRSCILKMKTSWKQQRLSWQSR